MLALFLWLAGAPAPAAALEMTPERLQAAIADTNAKPCYELKAGTFMKGVMIGCFTTPYSRVAAAASAAREAYKPFGEADVTPEMTAPDVHVHAFSFSRQGRPSGGLRIGGGRRGDLGMVNVVAVVVLPKDSKDRSKAIQPDRSEEDLGTYQNAYGAQFTGRNLLAVFPLSVLTESNEVHVVFDDKACELGGWAKDSKDCPAAFKLDNVK
jgi:hypothetical protein